jgi:hypothetical protein
MAAKERNLINECLKIYTGQGHRLFRCNTGTAWAGKTRRINKPTTLTLNKGDLIIQNARPFTTGWPKGTPDTIGLTSIKVTENMVGSRIAVFTAFEMKTGRLKPTHEQMNFIKMVNELGGISKIVRDINDIK